MPGIDFNGLRQEISMQQVLGLLGFEPRQPAEQNHTPSSVPTCQGRARWALTLYGRRCSERSQRVPMSQ